MATGTQKANKITQQYKQAIEGMQAAWPAAQQSLLVMGTTYTPQTWTTKLQQVAVPLLAAVVARIALDNALAARNDALPDAEALIYAFYAVLPQYLTPNDADAAKFGGKVKKPRKQPSTDQKQVANARREATRAARGIKGKKQRLAIKAPDPTATPPAATTTVATSATKTG